MEALQALKVDQLSKSGESENFFILSTPIQNPIVIRACILCYIVGIYMCYVHTNYEANSD